MPGARERAGTTRGEILSGRGTGITHDRRSASDETMRRREGGGGKGVDRYAPRRVRPSVYGIKEKMIPLGARAVGRRLDSNALDLYILYRGIEY